MKIIDLLNLVYKCEAPKKIKFEDDIYEYKEDKKCYINMDTNITSGNDYSLDLCLSNEVEIIEDKPNNIEKISVEYQDNHNQTEINEYLRCSINELAKAVNYLLEKSDV